MNIVIEDNIDFYKALEESDNEDECESCLISHLPLNENNIVLNCGHKFNLYDIYQEVIKQKTSKSRTLDQNLMKLKKNEFFCPYCRKLQQQLLPHVKNPSMKINIVNGVNSPLVYCMPYYSCEHINKSGKNKGKNCDCPALITNGKKLCNKHNNIFNKKSVEKTADVLCCAILKSGKRKGQQCAAKVCVDGATHCKRHTT
jgi:hypothetical protein